MGGAFRGRKLARRRREDSPSAPRAGRGGGWGARGGGADGGAACGLRGGHEPRGRGAWLLSAVGWGGQGDCRRLAKQNLRAREENGF